MSEQDRTQSEQGAFRLRNEPPPVMRLSRRC
jgi:hypothetical protein